jgi:exodeoxyribonuclease V beta subunit
VNTAERESESLDWRTLPLAGRVLIEASAGTGKTFNIGLIFLRLILEQAIPVEKILVVTFTDAAAQELRERLRARLLEAERGLQALCVGQTGVDELAAWLAQKYTGADARLGLRRIQLARIDIDRAPIATIHAVCQRILREFPLDAGTGFGVDKLFDETELLRECIEDFWRQRYLGDAIPGAEEEILAKGPEDLLFDLRDLLARSAALLPLDAGAPPRARVLAYAVEFCRAEIPRRARQRDGQTYAMLIDGVHDRIQASRAFAQRLFEAFPAALIDEFQDTDRRQFAIFDRIYRDEADQPRGLMAMIGDPKQAIYAFRGGDIAAYLQARAQATARFALALNHRSSEALIGACNALYARSDGGFDDASVRYQQVTAAGVGDEKPYARDGATVTAPFFIHAFRGDARSAKGELLDTAGDLDELALDDCAERIVELLNDRKQTIGGKPVTPGDIAVLLPQNRQVAELRKRLSARGVPCVGSGRGSVFDTDVARELELVLYAVLNAEDERAVRGALATRLLGKRYADILDWQHDSAAFETELERFAAWRVLARSCGVLAVLRELLAARGAQLLALPDGERLLTDLRHLSEALAEQESVSGLDGAYAWFAAIRREGDDVEVDAAQARQLRIESDSKRVQLMTLHAAKGLEFPIVFLPLAWRVIDRRTRKPKILYFHDARGQACVDVGSAQFNDNRVPHDREDLQERLRLLYVGLTRAIHAVHVYWVDRKQARTETEYWPVPAIDRLIRSAQRGLNLPVGESSLVEMSARLTGLAIVGPAPHATTQYIGITAAKPDRAARAPLPASRPFQWLHSFSTLTRHAVATAVESAAADEAEPAQADDEARDVAHPQLLALEIWRGRRFGDAVHKILEDSLATPLNAAVLTTRFAGLAVRPQGPTDSAAFETVAKMLERARTSDLGDGLCLADLPPASRVAEFEFQFPVDVSLRHLRAVCASHGCNDAIAPDLTATVLNGMLTGFADLIFEYRGRYHVLDYKTNRLGTSLADYGGAALDTAMRAHHYPLQALLYTIALHRYLRTRLRDYAPQQHLGESWYVFLRGVSLEPGAGVWRRRWPIALIDALDTAFAGEDVAA